VTSLAIGHWGTCPLKFLKFYAFCSCFQLNCKISKITKEKYVIQFRPSRYKHAKTHVNRLTKQNPGQGRRGKFLLCPSHIISWRRLWIMETGNQIELNNKVEKFIALLLFACAHLMHSAAQEWKGRTWLKRSSTFDNVPTQAARQVHTRKLEANRNVPS